MLRATKAPKLDRQFLAPQRHGRFPRMALRARSSDHPIAMFAMLVTAAFLSMALMAPASAILAAPDGATPKIADRVQDSGKTYRLPPVSDAGRACHGQAWGAETEDCLLAIIRQSGKSDGHKIRMIASAEPVKTTPNIF